MLSTKKKSLNKNIDEKKTGQKTDEKKTTNQNTKDIKTTNQKTSNLKTSNLKIINVIEQKIFTHITNLFSNNFYGGIYNLKDKTSQNKSNQKVFIIDWQTQASINYKDQYQVITAIQRYSQTDGTKRSDSDQMILKQITLPIPEIWVGQYYVFIPIPKMITFMYLPLDQKLKHVDTIRKIIHQLIECSENNKHNDRKFQTRIPFNNYLLNEDTNEIKSWEFMPIEGLSIEEYARYLQVCFVIQLVCKNVLECNQFQVQLQFRTLIQRLDNFMSSEEKNKSCPVKYWRMLFSPYYIYERYLDVNLFQMFVNTVSQNEKMINQLVSALQRKVIKVY